MWLFSGVVVSCSGSLLCLVVLVNRFVYDCVCSVRVLTIDGICESGVGLDPLRLSGRCAVPGRSGCEERGCLKFPSVFYWTVTPQLASI